MKLINSFLLSFNSVIFSLLYSVFLKEGEHTKMFKSYTFLFYPLKLIMYILFNHRKSGFNFQTVSKDISFFIFVF